VSTSFRLARLRTSESVVTMRKLLEPTLTTDDLDALFTASCDARPVRVGIERLLSSNHVPRVGKGRCVRIWRLQTNASRQILRLIRAREKETQENRERRMLILLLKFVNSSRRKPLFILDY
jgi:hypothetical protein